MKKALAILSIIIISAGASWAFNGSSFDTPVRACVNHILVPTEEQALSIKMEINSFEDFQRAAMTYSQCPSKDHGGNLGCFGYGQMVKPFEKAAFSGEIGEVIGPVKTQFGYHLLWITRRF